MLHSIIKRLDYKSVHCDFHKQFYRNLSYLPRVNNIQYIIRSFPKNLYKYRDENQYNYPNYMIENGLYNDIYYYRKIDHLTNMFDSDYYDALIIDSIEVNNYNPSIKYEYHSIVNSNIVYYFTLTNDPVHHGHSVIVNRNEDLRAHHFYYPNEKYDILQDMIDINLQSGNYVYNSIELGSIPERVHFHTSSDIPPLNYFDSMVHLKYLIYKRNGIRFYKVLTKKFICANFYYIEIKYPKVNVITKILPKALLKSRLEGNYLYMAQVFMCPDNGMFTSK